MKKFFTIDPLKYLPESTTHPNPYLKQTLDNLYLTYNFKSYIHPDPLEFVYLFKDTKNQEITGLIAACLAYGQVNQILKSIKYILHIMQSPYEYLIYTKESEIKRDFHNFKHRFTNSFQLCTLLLGIKKILYSYNSLQNCFESFVTDNCNNYANALDSFVKQLNGPIPGFLPSFSQKSACKRLNLFLRWMIRKDDVDPGCWANPKLSPSKLIIPLDTHMHKISLRLKLTNQKSVSINSALEITTNLKKYDNNDPIKYDFVLTRFGIQKNFYRISENKRVTDINEDIDTNVCSRVI